MQQPCTLEEPTNVMSHDEGDDTARSFESIFVRAQNGDEEAIRLIFEQYYYRVIGFVRRYVDSTDIEDVTQDVFIRVLRNIHNVEKAGAFEGYLFQAAKNRCINWLRKKHRVRGMMDLMWHAVGAWRETVVKNDQRRATTLTILMEALPPEDQKILEMFYIYKHSRAEMASLLKQSSATVYRKLASARAKLLQRADELDVQVIFKGRHDVLIQEK
mgnify:CR=1 FL=1